MSIIMAHEATIKTASVEIKTLSVAGRQVTMGLFRQLRSEPVLDAWSGEMRGTPWGTVNYFFAPCSNNHLHVVWQQGEELRRACLYESCVRQSGWADRLENEENEAKCWVAALAIAGDLMPEQQQSLAKKAETYHLPFEIRNLITPPPLGSHHTAGVYLVPEDEWQDYHSRERHYQKEPPWQTAERRERRRKAWVVGAEQFMASSGRLGSSADDLADEHREVRRERFAFAEEWKRNYQAIAALDQLFIAV